MKRIIEGAVYDTTTASKVALHRKQEEGDRQVTHYRTRQGIDFYHLQNYEGSEGHLQNSFEQVQDSYWHERYHLPGEVGENAAPAEVRRRDRHIRRKRKV